jgi:hypothetical protein
MKSTIRCTDAKILTMEWEKRKGVKDLKVV